MIAVDQRTEEANKRTYLFERNCVYLMQHSMYGAQWLVQQSEQFILIILINKLQILRESMVCPNYGAFHGQISYQGDLGVGESAKVRRW